MKRPLVVVLVLTGVLTLLFIVSANIFPDWTWKILNPAWRAADRLHAAAVSAYAQMKNPNLRSLSDSDLKSSTIRLERIRCFGNCPAYSVTIHGDGRLEYEGKEYVAEKGVRQGWVEAEEIKAVFTELANARFLTMTEEYGQSDCKRYCTDMAGATTEVTVKGVAHRVKHDYGCGAAPKALFSVESAIDKAAKIERWTGDVSKSGPDATTCWNFQ
jgi:hypothetical protein